MPTAGRYAEFVWAYFKANLQMAMEYRVSFLTQVFGMFINDGIWLVFWWLYFTKFPVVEGWERRDILTLWAVLTLAFGLSVGICGNVLRLSNLIATGQMDYYLALPKNVLCHALVSRMEVTGLGDALFGLLTFAAFTHPTPVGAIVYLVSAVLSAVIMTSFWVIAHSLAFVIGNAEALATQVSMSMIHFSTYPTGIFHGAVRVILFTLIPAGFISYIPVSLIRQFNWGYFAALLGAAAGLGFLAVRAFNRGLRRYESGNLMAMRS